MTYGLTQGKGVEVMSEEEAEEEAEGASEAAAEALRCRSWPLRQTGKYSQSIQKEVDVGRIHRQESVRLRDAGPIQKTLNLF
jgi:hypothetical protein